VLWIALAFSIVVALTGAVVVTRAAMRFSRRLVRLGELIAATERVSEHAHELRTSAEQARVSLERLRALTQMPA
jgi:hypothetical protein